LCRSQFATNLKFIDKKGLLQPEGNNIVIPLLSCTAGRWKYLIFKLISPKDVPTYQKNAC